MIHIPLISVESQGGIISVYFITNSELENSLAEVRPVIVIFFFSNTRLDVCLCILEEDRQDDGKDTALVARLQQKAKQKTKKTREEHKRTKQNIYKANILLACIVCSGSIRRPSMER
jgi:mannitol-specific phosphotransferase system IIBC component